MRPYLTLIFDRSTGLDLPGKLAMGETIVSITKAAVYFDEKGMENIIHDFNGRLGRNFFEDWCTDRGHLFLEWKDKVAFLMVKTYEMPDLIEDVLGSFCAKVHAVEQYMSVHARTETHDRWIGIEDYLLIKNTG